MRPSLLLWQIAVAYAEIWPLSRMQAGAGVLSAASQAAQRAAGPPHEAPLVIPLADILAVRRCNDPSLPAGEAFWVCLQHMRQVGTTRG